MNKTTLSVISCLTWTNGVSDETFPNFLANILWQMVQQKHAVVMLHNPQCVQNCVIVHRALLPVGVGVVHDMQAAVTVE